MVLVLIRLEHMSFSVVFSNPHCRHIGVAGGAESVRLVGMSLYSVLQSLL